MSGCTPNEPEWGACDLPSGDHGAAQVQEYRADFATPGHTLEHASLALRPDAVTMDMLEIPCVGPDFVADPSKGLLHRVWKVNARTPGRVTLARCSHTVAEMLATGALWEAPPVWYWEEEVEVFTYSGDPIVEVDLGFDQNGNIVVCTERAGEVWLYWFDPREGSYVFHALCPGRTPRILLDDPETTTESDLLIFYALADGSAIEMRQQRELYEVAHPTPASGADLRCEEVAKASNYRLHVYYSRHNAETGRYELVRLESAPYPLRLGDAMNVWQTIARANTARSTYALAQYDSPDFWHDPTNLTVMQSLARADVLDLVVIYQSTPEAISPRQTLESVETGDLVLRIASTPEALTPRQTLVRAATATYVLVMPEQDAEALSPSMTLGSVRTF